MAMKRNVVVLMLSVLLPTAAIAAAPSPFDENSITVSYADLDVDSEAGARTLYTRLRSAAERVCGVGSHLKLGSLAATIEAKDCYTESLDRAVAEIDNEQLTRIHES